MATKKKTAKKAPAKKKAAAPAKNVKPKAPPKNAPLIEQITFAINKEFAKKDNLLLGEGFITRRLSDLPEHGVSEWIDTGSVLLNGVIGHPGIPVGKLTSILGKPSSGKTTLTIHLMVGAQRMGAQVILIEPECKFDPTRARRFTLKLDDVPYYTGLTLQEMFAIVINVCEINIRSGAKRPILIIVDSHSSLPTVKEVNLEDDESGGQPGQSAFVTSQYLTRVIQLLGPARTALVFVCQPKVKVETQGRGSFYGPKETYKAENPIYFHSALQLKTIRIGDVKVGETVVGIESIIRVVKSNIGSSKRQCVMRCLDTIGFDDTSSILDVAILNGLVVQYGGGYFRLVEDTNGDQKFRRATWPMVLDQHQDLRAKLFDLCNLEAKTVEPDSLELEGVVNDS